MAVWVQSHLSPPGIRLASVISEKILQMPHGDFWAIFEIELNKNIIFPIYANIQLFRFLAWMLKS